MPRILLAIDQFWGPQGGTEQNIVFLSEYLPKVGMTIQMVALSLLNENCQSLFEIPVHTPRQTIRKRGLNFISNVRRLSRIIRQEKIDIVHAFCPLSELASILAVRGMSRVAVMGSRRNAGYWHNKQTLWRSRMASRFVDHFIANCEAAKKFSVSQEWIPEHKVSVIPNPLNLSRLSAGVDSPEQKGVLGIRIDENVVVMVATLRPVKDHSTLLAAAKIVLDAIPNTRFVLVGEATPEEQLKLRTSIELYDIATKVLYLGKMANPIRILPLADVGVLCSQSEGHSNAVLEYSACGLPSVVTRVGGLPEMVEDGVTGFLVPPASPEALAERIITLLHSPDLRKSMGAAARARAFDRNHPGQILSQYELAYRDLVHSVAGK